MWGIFPPTHPLFEEEIFDGIMGHSNRCPIVVAEDKVGALLG